MKSDIEEIRDLFRPGGTLTRQWGKQVQDRRLAMGFSVETLADACGTSTRTIQRVEEGTLNPRDHLKAAIARWLGCQVPALFKFPSYGDLTSYDQAAI